MKPGTERAERSKASEAPPLHRYEYEHEYKHECENELHNQNGRRASRAKREEQGTTPYTDMSTDRDHFLNTFRKVSSLSSYPLC